MLRNDEGEVVVANALPLSGVSSPRHAEASVNLTWYTSRFGAGSYSFGSFVLH